VYRVLLVDDDPIVISGIKHLIDWKKNNCVIEDTASDGFTAQKKIKRLRPDLVICDITMPELNGIDLLKHSSIEYPDIVFVMLTNHKEFEFAKESLHNRAVKYLLKTDLEPQVLEKAVENAIEECEKRKKLHRIEEADKLLNTKEQRTQIRNALISFLYGKPPMSSEKRKLLEEKDMLKSFAFALIPLNFSFLPEYSAIPKEELHRIFEWETEITEYLSTSFFKHSTLLPHSPIFKETATTEGFYKDLLLFAWKLKRENWESDFAHFRRRLIKTSSQITRLGVEIIASEFFSSAEENLKNPLHILRRIEEQHYRAKDTQSDIVHKALQFILANVEKRITLQDIADFTCISPSYLSTLFKREYKRNLIDFINQTKIDQACEYLKDNKYRINEISNMLGFENAFYFSRVFRKQTNLTPSEFRAKAQSTTPPPQNESN